MRINAFYNQTSPQILLEEVVSYFIQAQDFYTSSKKYTSISVVPHGNWFHTGILQALSYTYLQQQSHDAYLLITTQDDIEEPITTDHKQRGKLRGRETPFAHDIIKSSMLDWCKINNKAIKASKPMTNQLPFILASKPTPIIPLIIPTTFDAKVIKQIHKLQKEYNIGIITVVDSLSHDSKEESLTSSKAIIQKLQDQKKIPTNHTNPGFTLAAALSKKCKQKLELVGYLNSSEQHNVSSEEIFSYISMIA